MEMDSITSLFIVYRYDSTTGTFTVPPGGDGFYYFSLYLLVRGGKYATFDIEVNGFKLCTAYTEQFQTSTDEAHTSCSTVTYAAEGLCKNKENNFKVTSIIQLLFSVFVLH